METIGPFIAAGLTLMVFSYIFGDNVLFKLASHIFVGVAVGYAILVVWHQVFYPALTSGNLISVLPALILCVLLIFKVRPTQGGVTNALGSLALAFVLGVGAALALGGALFGTLLPQTSAVANISLHPSHYPDTENEVGLVIWLNNIIIVLGTLGTFFYFTFAVRSEGVLGGLREGIVRFFAGMGRLMLIFTLGALFANTVSSRVALLVSRLQFLMGLFGG
ncbi:MAG: hypothetical protein HS126_10005 [Anaerolineales bacterium]|nr:hypothetical protein [Anaerolineales bacterium]